MIGATGDSVVGRMRHRWKLGAVLESQALSGVARTGHGVLELFML